MGRTVRKRSRTLREREKEMSEARNFLRFITFFGIVIGVLVVVGLVLSSSCKAQTTPENYRKSIVIYAFKGLNTAEGLFVATPDYAKVCNNVDFSRNGFSIISKRWGFDTVKTVAGIDSIVGLGTYQRSNRQSCLVYAVDDSTKGYGAIYAMPYGSDNPDSATKIKDHWSIQNPTRFSQYNDNLYAANGQQQGMVWNGSRVRKFPLLPTGLPEFVPLSTAGNLDGEYRYIIYLITAYTDSGVMPVDAGGISPPVYVKNGKVLMRGFSRLITDSLFTGIDSAYCYMARTKKNPGAIDNNDAFYKLSTDKIWLKYDSGNASAVQFADTITYTDNIADGSLQIATLTVADLSLKYGRDSSRVVAARRYGAPTFVSSNTSNASQNRITFGALDNVGYAYMVTVADTILGLESDSSRVLWIGQKRYGVSDSALTAKRFTIGLPRISTQDTGLMFNIYRATIIVTARKYFLVCGSWHLDGTPVCDRWDTVWATNPPGNPSTDLFLPKEGSISDSGIAVDWYLVGRVATSQTQFIDSIRSDSARLRPRFNLSTQPEIFSQIFQWRSKLGGIAGSRIWFSSQFVDSQGNFGTNDFDDFNRNDGDFITGVKEKQFGLVVKKNRSSYVAPNGGGRPEKVSSFGCVAPLSYVSTDVGDLFVGDGGVYLETEGQALERVYNAGLVSEKLSNFVNMPDSVRRTIAGFWLPEKRQAIFSADYPNTSNDTAFVIDFRAGQIWSTWTNMVPKFGCLYSKNSTLGSPPPQTFYFTKAGGKTIYTYATNNKDANGNYPAITYQTVPLFVDWDKEQVDAIGLIHTDPSYGSLAIVDVVNEKDSAICAQKSFDSLGFRYVYKDMGAIPSVASAIRITTGTLGSTTFSNGIEAIEVLYRKGVEKVMVK